MINNGGTTTLVKSLKCARRGGIVSQVGHLDEQNPQDGAKSFSTIIDRRVMFRCVSRKTPFYSVNWLTDLCRGINAGSKHGLEDMCGALHAIRLPLDGLFT